MTAEESESDSDEDLEGGVRHDLMMADEKVWFKMGIGLEPQTRYQHRVLNNCDIIKN